MAYGLNRILKNLMPSTGRSLPDAIGYELADGYSATEKSRLIEFINIKLAALGWPIFGNEEDYPTLQMSKALLSEYQARTRILGNQYSPVDLRIHDFLNSYFAELEDETIPTLPANTFLLDRHGLAKALSLPADSDKFESDIVSSYRTANGVLHNPAKDRRTTKGVFHVVEGGSPIPWDKKAVPKVTFIRMLKAAISPPDALATLPFTSTQQSPAHGFVSLMLRPVVCPAVEGFTEEKTMEVRFFAPGNLVSNLDFVESIFGNAGDPFLSENDAALDSEHWTGHTGCVILAPQLIRLKKKDLGLPNAKDATERQKRDGMCWEDEDELYNDGGAFKLTVRDKRGVVITLIADNYFGYCKKEVKTQISMSANLSGHCEEEHAGGALAFPSYDLGEDFRMSHYFKEANHTFKGMLKRYGDFMELKPEGYAVDKYFPEIHYVHEDAHFTLHNQKIAWKNENGEQVLRLLPGNIYVLPSGYKVEMLKPGEGRRWRLVGTRAEPTLCHKPCTVSGGGKSEISKSIADAIINGPIFVANFKEDMEHARRIIDRDYSDRLKIATGSAAERKGSRPLLSMDRSLGSVIKLLTPGPDYTDDYNVWLENIPMGIKELVFLIKRYYKPDWGNDWMERFTVDVINGVPGNELKYRGQKILTSYLRVGYDENGSWRTFGLRKDFNPAAKIQEEDDITASVVVPFKYVEEGMHGIYKSFNPSVKFVKNCEYRLFQRPDDAIHRGYDKQTEKDMAQDGNFFSNYQPLNRDDISEMRQDAIRFDYFTSPMRELLTNYSDGKHPEDYIVCSANPRIVDGKPSKNPRYLQTRPDIVDVRARYLHTLGTRLFRRVPLDKPVFLPVNAVLPGRRNNPPEPGVPPLSTFNPIHYLELPELFMEFISSMTGKSPSTTGAGSEGALTKAPFNAMPAIIDLNNALVSYLVTNYDAFITAAGYVGPKYRMDHDISLLVPELWCRMWPDERSPKNLIASGCLERMQDFEYKGRTVRASLLGYRITDRFVKTFFGRIFSNPGKVLTREMLMPELQDMQIFVDSMDAMEATHKTVAMNYFNDGSIEYACPPLKALLHIMAYGEFEGKKLDDPEVRELFDPEKALASDWYQARLDLYKVRQGALLERHKQSLEAFARNPANGQVAETLGLQQRREKLEKADIHAEAGMLGIDPATIL